MRLYVLLSLALGTLFGPYRLKGAPNVAEPSAAHKTASFKFSTQTLTVPEGYTVEQVAAPPSINRPISVAFDEQGRLYATDSSGLSERATIQFEKKPHRVVRLEDFDGDGHFEKSVVFAENMMFPQGALFFEGSLYVGAAPHIWKLTDANGDGVSDARIAWYDGKTLTGCGNDLHGPYLGLDGWIYWTKGASAQQHHRLPDGRAFDTRAAHIFRSPSSGNGVEPMLTGGMDNPVGVTFTSTGERILSGTFFVSSGTRSASSAFYQVGSPGQRDGLIHAIYGGVYGKDQPSIVGHTRTGDLMPIMTHMGAAAPCGSTTYRSRVFGDDFADNVFVCYFNLRKVSRHRLVPDGASFKTIDSDFVTSDSLDFHPTDVIEDADGSLLVIDTGGWYKICCPTSQLAKPDVLGGIYRIRKTGAPKVDDSRGLKLRWANMASADLVQLLGDDRPYVAERAVHSLGKQGDAAVAAIDRIALKATSASARRNTLWALARIDGEKARAAVRQALTDPDQSVVQTALQGVSLWRDRESVDRLIGMLNAENAVLVRLAAEALGRIGDAKAISGLFAAINNLRGTSFTASGTPAAQGERILEHALIYALIQIGRREEVFTQLQSSRNPRVLRVAMVALDQMPDGRLQAGDIIKWLDSSEPVLKQTAGWIVAHHPDWGDALAAFFRRRLQAKSMTRAERAEVQTQIAGLTNSVEIQALLVSTAHNAAASAETRLLALRAMASTGLKATPDRWLTDLASLLAQANDAAVTRQAVATARSLNAAKTMPTELAAALASTGRNTVLPADVRLDALAATTPDALATVEPPLFDFLRNHLAGSHPMLVRGAAATVLAIAPLSPQQQLALADTLRSVGPLEVSKLLSAFEANPTESLGLKVVASLHDSAGLVGLRVNQLKSLLAKYSPMVQRQGENLLTLINADAGRQNARVEELLPGVTNGDIRRGQAVFHSPKAACTVCHMMGFIGGRLGPDLSTIGKIRNERELLEAIIFPSATFVRGYEPFTVTTKDRSEHTGLMKKDTAEEVVLVTGPESEQRIVRADIRDIQPGAVSPMPPGADVVLSRQELSDLVAFLKAQQALMGP